MADEYGSFERQVITWLAEWFRVPVSRITPTTEINGGWRRGLGGDGADADDMVEHLMKRSGLTFRGFDYDRFFGPELPFMFFLDRLIDRIRGRPQRPLEPLTVRMLAEFMWIERPALRA